MIKKIFIFFGLLICFIFLDLSISSKKINAFTTGFENYRIYISDRNPDAVAYCTVYNIDVANSNQASFNYIIGTNVYYYLYVSGSTLYISYYDGDYSIKDSFVFSTGLIQVIVDYDVDGLYLFVYELSYTNQSNQNIEPAIDGINRTLKVRQNLGSDIESVWTTGDLMTIIVPNDNLKFTFNYCYLETGFNLTTLNNWVDYQVLNAMLGNSNIHVGYLSGYSNGYANGYDVGLDEGEDIGHSNGYNEGYDAGYLYGYDDGYEVGDNDGYANGYEDGEAGNNAVHPLWAMIRDIAGGIGDILALQLGPGITIGTIIFVPLFFSALGLILWIWRRN